MPRRLSAGIDGVTWADARKLLVVTVTDADRLGLWAGDGGEDWLAPESVRRDPGLLLRWCQVNQPETVLSDAAALHVARDRTMKQVVGVIRDRDPKAAVTPADVVAELKRGDPNA